MYSVLKEQNTKPPLFSRYTAAELWTEPHVAGQMLTHHLDPDAELASRSRAFIERSVQWLSESFHLGQGRRVLDLGCGPGLYTMPLAQLGCEVTGVDFSAFSLEHAKEAAQNAVVEVDYREANYLELTLESSYDLILLIFGDFCPLSPTQRAHLLSNISTWLAPGGKFVFDVTSLAHFHTVEEESGYTWVPDGGFWAPGPHFVFNNRFTYPDEEAYLDRYSILEAHGRREIFNWIQCFTPESLTLELEEAGFRLETCIGNLAGNPYDPEATFFGAVAALP